MPTHRERILAAMRGEMVDVIPFVPRLDLWWLANVSRGTLPREFEGMRPDDISRSRGWAVYHMVPNFGDVTGPEDALHRSIGLFNFKQSVYRWRFGGGVEVNVIDDEGRQVVEYHTPLGMVRTAGGLTEEMRKAGVSLGWVQENLIKEPRDYEIAGYIFRHLEVSPNYEAAADYIDATGEDGVVAVGGPTLAASPVHQIQKELIDPTRFFYEYSDNPKRIYELAESLRRHADLSALLRAGDPALAAPRVRGAERQGEDPGHAHRWREPRPHGPDSRLRLSRRRVGDAPSHDQGHDRGVLPPLAGPAHDHGRHSRERADAGDGDRGGLRGLPGPPVRERGAR
jgi:hypothetical protein